MTEQEQNMTAGQSSQETVVPVIPVRGMVLFPGLVFPVSVGRARSVAAAQDAARREASVLIVLQRDPQLEDPVTLADLHAIGTLATVLRYVTAPDGSHHLVVRGEQRCRLVDMLASEPFLQARVLPLREESGEGKELEASTYFLKQQALEALRLLPNVPEEMSRAIEALETPGSLADFIAAYMDLKPEEKQAILELTSVPERLERVQEALAHRLEVLRLTQQIGQKTKEKMEERQREALLREQLRTIQSELGVGEERSAELEALQAAIKEAGMPAEVEEHALKELRRLERMPEGASEYAMGRTYLDWLLELPWSRLTEETLDIAHARTVLDEDHFDLEKVKRRILEQLAVLKLNPRGKAPILCFVGPPGVGKTSLGQSIARATGRRFVRVSLGGVHDEAEIRGHRRTYVGALPGNIIQALRKAGSANPVMLLDEVDKLGRGIQGDPAAALLEVLDPEQNATFRDNYLGVPFDLSRVFFIATANVLDEIPWALRDRMELIELPGYTEEDKLEIAKRYLIKRQQAACGLADFDCRLTDEALRIIIQNYTREAGCRMLEQRIGAVFRHVALQVAEGGEVPHVIEASQVAAILGPRRFENELAMRTSVPGVATGLAWTPVGGDILFIEASLTPGHGKLILTGQLGDVMKESAQAALSLVKARSTQLGLDVELFDRNDIHIHIPSGAIPKDGPSAGVALFMALVSLVTGRKVRSDTAMTGEITLRGLVLPVGGIKEKLLAAHSAGISRVMLPERNRKDYEEIPQGARQALELIWISTVDEALEAALCPLESSS